MSRGPVRTPRSLSRLFLRVLLSLSTPSIRTSSTSLSLRPFSPSPSMRMSESNLDFDFSWHACRLASFLSLVSTPHFLVELSQCHPHLHSAGSATYGGLTTQYLRTTAVVCSPSTPTSLSPWANAASASGTTPSQSPLATDPTRAKASVPGKHGASRPFSDASDTKTYD